MEASGNLFEEAALTQLGTDGLPQPGIRQVPRAPWLACSGGSPGWALLAR